MNLNYYALAVAILANCIPETAFEKLQSDRPSKVQNQINDDDYDDMVKLHQDGLFFREIGEIYCMDPSIIHRKLKKTGRIVIGK